MREPALDARSRVLAGFRERFGRDPELLVRAPGRVNLIGEHTDYNDGFVLPMAIDRAMWLAVGPRDDDRVTIRSLDFDEDRSFTVADFDEKQGGWIEYVRSMAWAFGREGMRLRGWDGVMAGEVPIGAGLSSSAALQVASGRAFAAVAGLGWEPARMAKLAQAGENGWIGVSSGIMDQMISAAGRAGHALLIDCRSLATEAVPVPPHVAVVVMDTATRRDLVESEYNVRREQCEAAAAALGIAALRDIDVAELERRAGEIEPLPRRRARHVVTENARTLAAADALRAGDARELGRLMDASHESLRVDYEVSSPELDRMVDLARANEACFGARMSGAGFGGCAVALVEREGAECFTRDVEQGYRRATGIEPALYVSLPSEGAILERL